MSHSEEVDRQVAHRRSVLEEYRRRAEQEKERLAQALGISCERARHLRGEALEDLSATGVQDADTLYQVLRLDTLLPRDADTSDTAAVVGAGLGALRLTSMIGIGDPEGSDVGASVAAEAFEASDPDVQKDLDALAGLFCRALPHGSAVLLHASDGSSWSLDWDGSEFHPGVDL